MPLRRKCPNSATRAMESLERRLFMSAARITSFFADNRGRVQMNFDQPLNLAGINLTNVKLYTSGSNGILGDSDDVVQSSAKVNYNASVNRISTVATLAPNTRYRIYMNGNAITGTNGLAIDCEYNGANLTSGNGVAGGILQFQTSVSTKYTAKFTTLAGGIGVLLRPDVAPITVANFVSYANSGIWDDTFFHRIYVKAPPDIQIVQGGGYKINATNDGFEAFSTSAPIVKETALNNTRGTLAMARTADINSATDQWYFNVINNSALDGGPGTAYCAFGSITTVGGLASMDALAALTTFNVNAPVHDPNQAPGSQDYSLNFANLPVMDGAAVQARGYIDPAADLPLITRVAFKMDTSAISATFFAAPQVPNSSLFNTTFPIQPAQNELLI